MPRGPALGTLITEKKGRDTSSQYEFSIPLCDLLLDLVERDIDGSDALPLTGMAYSFAHDILHVSTLASALLWYEGVTPDLSRSTDLVSISVDVEASLSFLRSACDTTTPAFIRFAVDPVARGVKDDAKESFNGLLNWVGLGDAPPKNETPSQVLERSERAKERYALVSPPFHFLERHSGWFLHLKSLRDRLTHSGYSLVPYTERVFLEAWLVPPGKAELQGLHGRYKEEDYRENAPPLFKRYRLLETIKEFTTNLLVLSNDLYAAIAQELEVVASGTHFLSGIHIPALSELLSYQTPDVAKEEGIEYRLLRSKAWHLLRARDYWSATREGYPSHFAWSFKTRLTAMCGRPPVRASSEQGLSDSVSSWYVFCVDGKHYGVLTLDRPDGEESEIRDASESWQTFASEMHLRKAVLLVRAQSDTVIHADAGNVNSDLILIETDPVEAAAKVYAALTGRVAASDNAGWDDAPHSEHS